MYQNQIIHRIVQWLLNAWDQAAGDEGETITELSRIIDNDWQTAKRIVEAWQALPGETRSNLQSPEIGDITIRKWVKDTLARPTS